MLMRNMRDTCLLFVLSCFGMPKDAHQPEPKVQLAPQDIIGKIKGGIVVSFGGQGPPDSVAQDDNVPIPAFPTDKEPIPYDDLVGFNKLFQNLIRPMNAIIGQTITKAGLDPLQIPITGAFTSNGICGNLAAVKFNVTGVKGISLVKVDSVAVLGGDRATDGSLVLDFVAAMKPVDIVAHLRSQVLAKCAFLKPNLFIEADVFAYEVSISFLAQIMLTKRATDGKWITDIRVSSISSDFKKVLVHFNGVNQIFNPIMDLITHIVVQKFKDSVRSVVDSTIKWEVQTVIIKALKDVDSNLVPGILQVPNPCPPPSGEL